MKIRRFLLLALLCIIGSCAISGSASGAPRTHDPNKDKSSALPGTMLMECDGANKPKRKLESTQLANDMESRMYIYTAPMLVEVKSSTLNGKETVTSIIVCGDTMKEINKALATTTSTPEPLPSVLSKDGFIYWFFRGLPYTAGMIVGALFFPRTKIRIVKVPVVNQQN